MADINRGPTTLAVTIVFLVLSSIFVALRFISRAGIVKKVSIDDYVMLFAWVIAFGLSFAICWGTTHGLGRHQTQVPTHWETTLNKSEYAFSVLYNPALMATKTSILLFYLRLGSTERIFRWACYLTLVVVNAAGLALTFLNIFQCSPVNAVFKTPVPDNARCENIVSLYLSASPVNIITDLAMVVLPMPILTSMRLPKKQKIILIVTFGCGLFVAVIDVLRIAYLQGAATTRLQAQQTGAQSGSGAGDRNDSDISWYSAFASMWSAIEVHLGIVCGCVPMLKPLVSRYFPQWLRDINVRQLSTTRSGAARDSKLGSLDAAQQSPTRGSPPNSPPLKDKDFAEPAEASCSSASHHDDHGDRHTGEDAANARGQEEVEEPEMSFLDFLTTPETQEAAKSRQQTLASTANNDHGQTFFHDFVNMQQQKSLVDMTTRESLFPNIMVTVLFLIWGIAYGFLDTLNAQFQKAVGMTAGQSTGIHSAYFSGYFVAPLTFGRLCLKHGGFKACYITGLTIYACGVLVFWPSAVLTSFPAFLVSNFIVGAGLSTLEIAANPFVALCGPQAYMEVRLNLSQGVQAIGTIVSPLLAAKVLFRGTDANSLVDVQWTYLGIALFSVLLAVCYFYVPLPEATAADLERAQGQRSDHANLASFNGVRILWISVGLAVFSQWAYVGAQEAVATSFQAYYEAVFAKRLTSTSWQAIAHTGFAAGRFLAAGLNYFFRSRYLLLFFYLGAIALSAVSMKYEAVTAETCLLLLFVFEGPIFPQIFATGLRGVGRRTKDVSALLTAAISGGACWPPIMYGVNRGTGRGVQYGFCVIIAAFASGTILPIWQNAHPVARKLADRLPRGEDEDVLRSGSPTKRSKSLFKHRRRKEGSSGIEHVEDVPRNISVATGHTAELNTHGLDV